MGELSAARMNLIKMCLPHDNAVMTAVMSEFSVEEK
jgi:hypothetical protein